MLFFRYQLLSDFISLGVRTTQIEMNWTQIRMDHHELTTLVQSMDGIFAPFVFVGMISSAFHITLQVVELNYYKLIMLLDLFNNILKIRERLHELKKGLFSALKLRDLLHTDPKLERKKGPLSAHVSASFQRIGCFQIPLGCVFGSHF